MMPSLVVSEMCIRDRSYTDLDMMKSFFQKTGAMDVTKKTSFKKIFPEFYELIKDYE